MRKFFTLLFLALISGSGILQAQTFQIASCSAPLGSSAYGPMYSVATANATNRTAVIYPAYQVTAAAGQITSLYYNRVTATGTMTGTPTLKIYLKEVTSTDWGATSLDWSTAITGATLVFNGDPTTIVGSSAGWKSFPLIAPFNYSGSQNLAVFTEYTNATASTAITWSYEYTAPCINTNNDFTTRYSNVTTGVLPATLASSDYRRPLIGFDVTLTCSPPTAVTATNRTTSAMDISWTAPAVAPANGYEYYYSNTSVAPTLSTTASGSTGAGVTTTNIAGLSSGTLYYVYVRSVCSGSDKSPWQVATLVYTLPANDDCSQAVLLTVSPLGTCNTVAGSTFGATQSTETASTCSNTGSNDDVWYTFVATATTQTVALTGTSSTSAASVYSGSCGGLVLVGCASTTATVTGLTIGNTYYVRVYTTSTVVTTGSLFNICISAPPLNDECAGAPVMPITTFGSACNFTPVTTIGATISTVTGQANACTTTGINDDVWYTFTTGAAAGLYTFSYNNLTAATGTASTVGINVYTGSCGTLTIVTGACDAGFGTGGSGSLEISLAASTTYTLRLWVGSTANSGTFNFCITSPIPPPANDNCAGAILLVPAPIATCVTPTSGTTSGATQSPDAAPTCSATGINDDVWYSFVATSTTHAVILTNTAVASAAAIYGGSCGSLTQVGNSCTTEGTSSNSLVIGTTYYVRVYSTSATAGTDGIFEICITSPVAPVNDDCPGAVSLTASATNICVNPVAGTTAGSTPSTATASTCTAVGANDDVWYSFVATGSTHAVLISSPSTTTAASIYSGACGGLVLLGCGSGTDGSAIATGLTAGLTYYVRVYSTSATEGTISNFNICVLSAPSNDECSGAQVLTISTNNACTSPIAGSTLGATSSAGELTPGCSATGINDDVWYSFVATATTHTIALLNSTSTAAAQVYSGSCGGLALVTGACASTNVIAAGLTVGNTYYVRVYSTSTTAGLYSAFEICIGVLPTNDNCSNAINLTPTIGSCTTVAGSTIGATASGGTVPTCSGTGANDDVWYSFTATSSAHTVSILNASTTSAAAIYSGSCGALVEVACASTTTLATGLTVGNIYYVRVYSTSTTTTTYSNFDICISAPAANDNCASAVTLTQGVSVVGSTGGATQSQAPETCGTATASSALDVWYRFTATQNGNAIVSVTNLSASFDAVLQVYSGSCATLTNIGCADGPGAGGSEAATLTGLIAGQTYYLRVYGFNVNTGTFTVTVAGGAVPITVEYFNGNRQNTVNLLQWKVNCTNTPSATMILERSANQVNFEEVHRINATAARCLQPFSHVDGRPLAGTNYYRLKSVDADGKVTYSSIIATLNKARGMEIVSMLPNPVSGMAILNVSSATASKMQLIVTDIVGRQLESRSVNLIAGSNQVSLNFAKLASGVYYLTGASEDGDKKTIRFVKD